MLINLNTTRSHDLSTGFNLQHQTHRKITQCLRIHVLESVCGDYGNSISQPRRCFNDRTHQLILSISYQTFSTGYDSLVYRQAHHLEYY